MIAFAVRLALSGGRQAVSRLAVIAAAVAIGVGLLLSTLASINAVSAVNDRVLWFNSGSRSATETAQVDPLWWHHQGDYHAGREIERFDLAATGPDAPLPPGLSRLPAPGEYFVSPALAERLRTTPAAELGDRYPGKQAGLIGDAALPSPDSLIVIVGRTVEQVSALPGARPVTAIATRFFERCQDCPGFGIRGDAMTLILSVVAGALIFPVTIFIGTATRLSAAQREQRYAAMRLVGATPGQVALISAVESTLAAVVGTAAGFLCYLLLRPAVATVPFTGQRFFTEDLTLTVPQFLAVAVGVPLAAAVAARLALRRVTVSPLGVTRRVTPKPPRAWRLLPLLAGLGELTWFIGRRPEGGTAQTAAFLPGFMVVMIGLVIAGPWLTMVAARAMALRTSRPAALIAVRRLADDPKTAFRAVSGLVLALFVTSATVGIIGTINTNRGALSGDPLTRAAVVHGGTLDDPPLATAGIPAAVLAELRALPGVKGALVMHADPAGLGKRADDPRLPFTLVACSELATVPVIGRCPAGAEVVSVSQFAFLDLQSQTDTEWPAVDLTADELAALPALGVYSATDGSTQALERVRTLMTRVYPEHRSRTVGDRGSAMQSQLTGWQQLANVVLLTTLPIAGCSLAVSVVAGLSDRKRPFAMLRLTGVPLGMLRKVIGLESAVPLLAVSAVAVGTGFLTAQLFLKAQMSYDVVSPDALYYVLVALGLAASLGIIASTLPLLRRITGPEAARNG